MSEIANAIAPLIEQLADVFSVSVDFIQANFMEYVLKYGKYTAYTSLLGDCVMGFLAMIIPGGITLVAYSIENIYNFKSGLSKAQIVTLILGGIIMLATWMVVMWWNVICYNIQPEIYSIQQALELIG